MKRIRVDCAICLKHKYYSVHRIINKVCSLYACDQCRHFYLKVSQSPFTLECAEPVKGSCFLSNTFLSTRCKACWVMRILDCCPHPMSLYTKISEYLSEDCKKQLRGRPICEDEIGSRERGSIRIESYVNEEWVIVPSTDEEMSQLDALEDIDTGSEGLLQNQDSVPELEEICTNDSEDTSNLQELSVAGIALDIDDGIDMEEEETMADDPAPMMAGEEESETQDSEPVLHKDSDDSLSSHSFVPDRVKRQRKKVQYFTKPTSTGRRTKGQVYGADGCLLINGRDVCDCLREGCVGCHFPCSKCRSPKCGNECRVNRRWYYEKVEVEGTKLSWNNVFMHK